MTHDFRHKIEWLEDQWTAPDGVIGQARYGDLDWTKAEQFVQTVRSWERDIPADEPLPRRFVALLWSVPKYLDSHRPRIEANCGDVRRVDQLRASVFDAVSSILGLP